MTWLVIVASAVVAETLDEEGARTLAGDIALHGATVTIAQKVAQCEPYPQPQWTEAPGA